LRRLPERLSESLSVRLRLSVREGHATSRRLSETPKATVRLHVTLAVVLSRGVVTRLSLAGVLRLLLGRGLRMRGGLLRSLIPGLRTTLLLLRGVLALALHLALGRAPASTAWGFLLATLSATVVLVTVALLLPRSLCVRRELSLCGITRIGGTTSLVALSRCTLGRLVRSVRRLRAAYSQRGAWSGVRVLEPISGRMSGHLSSVSV